MKIYLKLQTYWRIGLTNILRVVIYRLGLRLGLHPVLRCKARIHGEEFFLPVEMPYISLPPSKKWDGKALYFGWYDVPLYGKLPAWQTNPFSGKGCDSSLLPWWKLSDFDLDVGDIKTVWEASRFDWVIAFATRGKAGDEAAIKQLNAWLANWCAENPCYYGPNWKCGQEASIRVIHLAMAAKILGQDKASPALLRLIEAHLLRIYPTTSYAIAQDNNHGTSEAAALYIGGMWCEKQGLTRGRKWARKGRSLLENRVKCLVAPDGSFSQYSLNYHRMMLDTLSMVEMWRRSEEDLGFSALFYQRAKVATDWLYALVDPQSGDAPNLGGNDGARLLPITNTDYRDYRPSVQLAMVLFHHQRAYRNEGVDNNPLRWVNISLPVKCAKKPTSRQFDDGGYAVLRNGPIKAVLKYPRYRFRPRHCDALHLDLWRGSDNLLRDGGSYSYNVEFCWHNYFTGTPGHNTIEFDGRDQMPQLDRFLRGAWLIARDVKFVKEKDNIVSFAAGYRDWKGACHHRSVQLHSSSVVVKDTVTGFANRAILRWRLQPGAWRLQGENVVCETCSLQIKSSAAIKRFELISGWESRYYYQKTPLPVLEVEIRDPGKITTKIFC